MQNKLEKMKFSLSEIKKKNPTLAGVIEKNLNVKTDDRTKLSALDTIIGYLIRNGISLELPIDILIDIANDYEKRLEE